MTDLLFAVKRIEANLKHLPGKHEQTTHAGSRGGVAGDEGGSYVDSYKVRLMRLNDTLPQISDSIGSDSKPIKGLVGQPDMLAYRAEKVWYMRQPKSSWIPDRYIRTSPDMDDELTVSYAIANGILKNGEL